MRTNYVLNKNFFASFSKVTNSMWQISTRNFQFEQEKISGKLCF